MKFVYLLCLFIVITMVTDSAESYGRRRRRYSSYSSYSTSSYSRRRYSSSSYSRRRYSSSSYRTSPSGTTGVGNPSTARSGGGWLQYVMNAYRQNRNWINPALGSFGQYFGKKDSKSMNDLATLKALDQQSFDEIMQDLRAKLEEDFPGEDIDEILERIQDEADMNPDEIDVLSEENDGESDGDGSEEDDLTKDL